jgi:hypothetical protein
MRGFSISSKPTAPWQNKFSVFVITPCRGLSLFSLDAEISARGFKREKNRNKED